MKRLLQLISLTALLWALPECVQAQNPGDSVFAGVKVHTVYLRFNQANYWDSLLYYYNQGNEQYMLASATIDGVLLDSIGVRLKGNASFAHPNNKKPFKLSFSEYNGNTRWDGLKSVHINNCWGDPTFLREKIHDDFCRDAGIPAPRCNFAVVYLNNVLWGLYSLEESVDKRFLGNHYPVTTGNLYKAVDGIGTAAQYISDFLWYTADTADYKLRYELKTDNPVTPWADLIRFIDTLNRNTSAVTALPKMADLTSVMRAFAADNILGNLDSYIGSGRNFYFYNQSTGSNFSWIVWDASLSLGAYPASPANIEQMSVTYISAPASRPLASFIFNNTSLKQQYLREVCRLTNRFLNVNLLGNKIDSIAAIIRPYVYGDTKKMYTNAQFESNLNSDYTPTGGKRIPGLKSYLNLRYTSIQNQLTTAGISCNAVVFPGDVVINEFMASNDTIPDPAGEFEDWIELHNRTSLPVDLSGCYLSDDISALTKWTFPAGTIIPAHGYLLIWADQDSGQAGLHASFKLSATGEQVVLSNSSVTILDTITFGQQINNFSFSRLPDGTGQFVSSQPTPGAPNVPLIISSSPVPSEFIVMQNYPNPFNPSTIIQFGINEQSDIRITIYSSLGEEVFNEIYSGQSPGYHSVMWSAKDNTGKQLPCGIYLCRISNGKTSLLKKMVFLK